MNYGWSSGGERFIIQGSSQNIKLWNKMSQNFKQIIKLYQQAFFYALSGCDPTLSIFGKSKKTSDGWKIFPDITGVCKTCICAVKK